VGGRVFFLVGLVLLVLGVLLAIGALVVPEAVMLMASELFGVGGSSSFGAWGRFICSVLCMVVILPLATVEALTLLSTIFAVLDSSK
jgi:hypothetical protein